MKPKGKEWDFLYLWLGRVTKWPRIKWGPQFNQVTKDTCGSGLVTSEVLSEHLVWVSPLIASTPPTFRSYQGSRTAPHPLSTFTPFIHSILHPFPHHWLPQGWARQTWCEGGWCRDRKVEVLPSGEGARWGESPVNTAVHSYVAELSPRPSSIQWGPGTRQALPSSPSLGTLTSACSGVHGKDSLRLCPVAPPNTESRWGSCVMAARGRRGASRHLPLPLFQVPLPPLSVSPWISFPQSFQKNISLLLSLLLTSFPPSLPLSFLSLSASLPAALSSRFESWMKPKCLIV